MLYLNDRKVSDKMFSESADDCRPPDTRAEKREGTTQLPVAHRPVVWLGLSILREVS